MLFVFYVLQGLVPLEYARHGCLHLLKASGVVVLSCANHLVDVDVAGVYLERVEVADDPYRDAAHRRGEGGRAGSAKEVDNVAVVQRERRSRRRPRALQRDTPERRAEAGV